MEGIFTRQKFWKKSRKLLNAVSLTSQNEAFLNTLSSVGMEIVTVRSLPGEHDHRWIVLRSNMLILRNKPWILIALQFWKWAVWLSSLRFLSFGIFWSSSLSHTVRPLCIASLMHAHPALVWIPLKRKIVLLHELPDIFIRELSWLEITSCHRTPSMNATEQACFFFLEANSPAALWRPSVQIQPLSCYVSSTHIPLIDQLLSESIPTLLSLLLNSFIFLQERKQTSEN